MQLYRNMFLTATSLASFHFHQKMSQKRSLSIPEMIALKISSGWWHYMVKYDNNSILLGRNDVSTLPSWYEFCILNKCTLWVINFQEYLNWFSISILHIYRKISFRFRKLQSWWLSPKLSWWVDCWKRGGKERKGDINRVQVLLSSQGKDNVVSYLGCVFSLIITHTRVIQYVLKVGMLHLLHIN